MVYLIPSKSPLVVKSHAASYVVSFTSAGKAALHVPSSFLKLYSMFICVEIMLATAVIRCSVYVTTDEFLFSPVISSVGTVPEGTA